MPRWLKTLPRYGQAADSKGKLQKTVGMKAIEGCCDLYTPEIYRQIGVTPLRRTEDLRTPYFNSHSYAHSGSRNDRVYGVCVRVRDGRCGNDPSPRSTVDYQLNILRQFFGHPVSHVALEHLGQRAAMPRAQHEKINAERGREIKDRGGGIVTD